MPRPKRSVAKLRDRTAYKLISVSNDTIVSKRKIPWRPKGFRGFSVAWEKVKKEIFAYQTNQYGLTRVNGAVFKKDGLIFEGKGYYYNYFTNKAILNPLDSMAGFAKIIQEDAGTCDILYRIDERFSMPEAEYYDYTGVAFAKFYGPQFRFERGNIKALKTVIVHINDTTLGKLLMEIKKRVDHKGEESWHIEIETLPYKRTDEKMLLLRSCTECIIRKEKYLHTLIIQKTNIAAMNICRNIQIVKMEGLLINIPHARICIIKFGALKKVNLQKRLGIN